MRKEDGNSLLLFLIFLVLLSVTLFSEGFSQKNKIIDTISQTIKVYPYPIPMKLNWGHDTYAAQNFILKHDTLSNGFWSQDFAGTNGMLARIFFIQDGQLDGKDIYFDTLQSLKRIDYYDKNVIVAGSLYYSDSQIRDSIVYRKDGERVFYCKWYENGNMSYEGTPETQTYFYPSGELRLKKNFKNKKLNGVIEYYSDTRDKYLINFREGKVEKYCVLIRKTIPDKRVRYKSLSKEVRNFIEYNFFQ